MTEHKKLAYKLEDIFSLGKSLPVVALRQLPRIADEFDALQESDGYLPQTHNVIANSIRRFVSNNSRYMDDERELKRIFKEECRLSSFGTRQLALFENR